MEQTAHKEEWPSGLCKLCYPTNPDIFVMHNGKVIAKNYPRCIQPTGRINFQKVADLLNFTIHAKKPS
jgi:hypothetical protein